MIPLIQQSIPSYSEGFARGAAESVSPHLWKGLVGAWGPSLGNTGDTLRDLKLRNDGAFTGGGWNVTERGQSFFLLDASDSVNLGDIGETTGIGALTISMWMKPDKNGSENNNEQLLAKWGADTSWTLGYQNAANNLVWFIIHNGTSSGSVITTTAIDNSKWWHLVGVYDGANVRIYVDGAEDKIPTAITGNIKNTTEPIMFGNYSNLSNDAHEGSFQNVLIYNRALSLSEIREVYIDGSALFRKKEIFHCAAPVVGGSGVTTGFLGLMGVGI